MGEIKAIDTEYRGITDTQLEAVEAYIETGSYSDAADMLGKDVSTVHEQVERVKSKIDGINALYMDIMSVDSEYGDTVDDLL